MHNFPASLKSKTMALAWGGEGGRVGNIGKKSGIASVLTNLVKGEEFKLIVWTPSLSAVLFPHLSLTAQGTSFDRKTLNLIGCILTNYATARSYQEIKENRSVK